MVHCIYLGVTGYTFQKHIVILSLKIKFVIANSADHDEMLHNASGSDITPSKSNQIDNPLVVYRLHHIT